MTDSGNYFHGTLEEYVVQRSPAYARLAHATEYAMGRLAALAVPELRPDGLHSRYVESPLGMFATGLESARPLLADRDQPPHFLDVGAGCGTRVLVAGGLGYRAFGLELRREYAEVAWRMDAEVELGDAWEYQQYDIWDLVYLYAPLVRRQDEAALEAFVWERMSSGSLLMLIGREAKPGGLDPVAPFLWRKP